jgi:hypothetical protein
MPQKSQYKIVTGTTGEITTQFAVLGTEGWRPILMNSVVTPKGVMVTVIFEFVIGS